MKKGLAGLRTEILLSLTLLLVAAMFLTSFVVLRIWERDLLRYHAAQGKALIQGIERCLEDLSLGGAPPAAEIAETLAGRVAWMAPRDRFGPVSIIGRDGSVWFGDPKTLPAAAPSEQPAFAQALGLEDDALTIERRGGLLILSAPLFSRGQPVATVNVPVPLQQALGGLRRSQQVIWFYIGLNVVVLLVFGTFLLSRVVVRPIGRLVKTADQFQDTDGFSFGKETSGNEIAHLTTSLNRMIKRLGENKDRMAEHIRSLEQANRELKEARDVVLRSEKLSSLGRLSAGVAHEVGNPLGAILGYTDLLRRSIGESAEGLDYLKRIEDEITRIHSIVRGLLDYARPEEETSGPTEINAVVSEAVSFFSRQKFALSVGFDTDLNPAVGLVWANQDRLKQVLINLLFNACDAMPQGGRVVVTTRRMPGPTEATGAPRKRGGAVVITVADTGTGIGDAERDKIFDPFFTTKPPGKGTGLGLAVSRRIIEGFGGSLTLKSKEGEGAVFMIQLEPWTPNHDT